MGGAIPVRCLQFIAYLALRGQRQALFGDGRSCDVTTEPLQLLPFMRFGLHAGMQREAGYLAGRGTERVVQSAGRQGLQGEHLQRQKTAAKGPATFNFALFTVVFSLP